jgi:hypothetical protein
MSHCDFLDGLRFVLVFFTGLVAIVCVVILGRVAAHAWYALEPLERQRAADGPCVEERATTSECPHTDQRIVFHGGSAYCLCGRESFGPSP